MKFLVVLLVSAVCVVVGYDPACSNQGMIYADTRVCECFQCFSGSDCSILDDECVVNVADGDPGVFQEYWYADELNVLQESADYRTPYQDYIPYAPDSATNSSIPPGIHKVLVPEIQKLHATYKNAVADGRYIVPAYGCTNLISATAYAFSELRRFQTNNTSNLINVYAKAPYYTGYSSMTYLFPGRMNFTTVDDYDDESDILEYVTYPNNPTGDFRQPNYQNSFHVYDSVYLWPSLVDYTEPLDVDVVLFSMSKATGHAGSRFGWALVKSKFFAYLMTDFLERASLEISVDNQDRSLQIMKNLNEKPYALFDYIKKVMLERWEVANEYLARQPNRFVQHSVAGTFYMLIECMLADEMGNCAGVFLNANMKGYQGSYFGLTENYVRIEMVPHTPVFNLFLQRLDALTSS